LIVNFFLHAAAERGQHPVRACRLRADHPVQIFIVGGAAGVLLGALPAAWTTADVDMVHVHLPQDRDDVLAAAEETARELSLPPGWLSEDVGLFAWTLPRGWRDRVVEVAACGQLRVFAVSRLDLVAMKFLAHRERDLEHLEQLRVTAADLAFARQHLDTLARSGEEPARVAMARRYVEAWVPQ
jgi:hypothetical protein